MYRRIVWYNLASNGQTSQNPPLNEFGPAADSDFNIDFSILESADVLENFDVDPFLNTSAKDFFNFAFTDHTTDDLTPLYSVSEDLSKGKLTFKDNAMKDVVREI